MRSRAYVFLVLILLLASGAGCGRPSHDLTPFVTGEDGSAIPQAQVILVDDIEDIHTASDTGEATWTGLEEDVITLTVQAEGFISRAIQVSLERGHNEAVVALQRAPIDWHSLSP